jgi:hypothetical protein
MIYIAIGERGPADKINEKNIKLAAITLNNIS